MDAVFGQNALDNVQIQLGLRHERLQVDATLLLPTQSNVGRLLVESNAESFQLALNNLLVLQRLEHVQDDEDETARASDGNYLTTATFAVLGTPEIKRVS